MQQLRKPINYTKNIRWSKTDSKRAITSTSLTQEDKISQSDSLVLQTSDTTTTVSSLDTTIAVIDTLETLDTINTDSILLAAAIPIDSAIAIDTPIVESQNTSTTDTNIVISDTFFSATNNPTQTKVGDTTVLSSSFDYKTKVRIISINKITKDTVVEWINLTDTTWLNNYTTPTIVNVPIPARIQVTEDALFEHHASIQYKQIKDSVRTYQVQGDTLFVYAPEPSLASLYKHLNQIQTPTSTTKNTNNKNTMASTPRGRNQRLERRQQIRETRKQIHDSIAAYNIALEQASRKKAIDSVQMVDAALSNSADTLIGDAWLDNDPEAVLMNEPHLLDALSATIRDNWRSMKLKAKAHYSSKKNDQSVNVNLRLINDSATWASLTVVVEAARVLITNDSSILMNRLQDYYVVYPNNQLQDLLQLPITVDDVQDLLVGGIPMQELKQVRAKRNSSMIGVYATSTNDELKATLIFNSDSTLRSAYVRGINKQGIFTLRCLYQNYENTPIGKISMNRSITSFINGVPTSISLEYSKVEVDVPCEVPFDIPAKFKREQNIKLKGRK